MKASPPPGLLLVLILCFGDLSPAVPRAMPQGRPSPVASAAPQRAGYVGDAACVSCHRQLALSYSATAHHLTSQQPTPATILGSFATGSNRLWIANPQGTADEPRLYFEMTRKPEGSYQTAVAELGGKHLTHTERLDLVFGSGVRGQTYLYWAGDQLSELPVSYWTDGQQWINSPGFGDGTANFSRHVDPRCMECHTTYIKALSPDPQSFIYDKATLVTGISCETCHGPGAAHVSDQVSHSKNTAAANPGTILNPARFNRDRQVDACALCHNGTQQIQLRPAFTFIPGEHLDRFFASTDDDEAPDVHGNQAGLLKRSRCYLGSAAMSCATCHDVHAPERPPASYSSRCLSCHEWRSCGASKTLGHEIVQNCIGCHMPLQDTRAIVSVTAGRTIRARIRTHWIKVYPELSSEIEPNRTSGLSGNRNPPM
jgi:hypothetical protein